MGEVIGVERKADGNSASVIGMLYRSDMHHLNRRINNRDVGAVAQMRKASQYQLIAVVLPTIIA